MPISSRILLFFAGITGACGIALSAAAYHGDNAILQSAALVCLANGPALIGLAIVAKTMRAALAAGIVTIFGTALFAGDLVAKTYAGISLLPMAAPIGGTAVILGWLIIALSAFLPARQ